MCSKLHKVVYSAAGRIKKKIGNSCSISLLPYVLILNDVICVFLFGRLYLKWVVIIRLGDILKNN